MCCNLASVWRHSVPPDITLLLLPAHSPERSPIGRVCQLGLVPAQEATGQGVGAEGEGIAGVHAGQRGDGHGEHVTGLDDTGAEGFTGAVRRRADRAERHRSPSSRRTIRPGLACRCQGCGPPPCAAVRPCAAPSLQARGRPNGRSARAGRQPVRPAQARPAPRRQPLTAGRPERASSATRTSMRVFPSF